MGDGKGCGMGCGRGYGMGYGMGYGVGHGMGWDYNHLMTYYRMGSYGMGWDMVWDRIIKHTRYLVAFNDVR